MACTELEQQEEEEGDASAGDPEGVVYHNGPEPDGWGEDEEGGCALFYPLCVSGA